jgi:hypothetical protein
MLSCINPSAYSRASQPRAKRTHQTATTTAPTSVHPNDHSRVTAKRLPEVASNTRYSVWISANKRANTTLGEFRHANPRSQVVRATQALVPPQNGHAIPVVTKKPQSGMSLATANDATPSPIGQAAIRLDRHTISANVSRGESELLDSAFI